MTLCAKIEAKRLERIHCMMRDDHVHGRSRNTEIEHDGADAAANGYLVTSCPYATTAALDAAGRPVPVTDENFTKAAAWRRGWMLKQLAMKTPGRPTTLIGFWERLNICLEARGIKAATFGEVRDFWEFGEREAQRVAAFWSADQLSEAAQ